MKNTKKPTKNHPVPAPEESPFWTKFLLIAQKASKAAVRLLRASDALADEAGLDKETVLTQLMPGRGGAARESQRLIDWLTHQRTAITVNMGRRELLERKQQARAKLVASLKLTKRQKRILGIEGIA